VHSLLLAAVVINSFDYQTYAVETFLAKTLLTSELRVTQRNRSSIWRAKINAAHGLRTHVFQKNKEVTTRSESKSAAEDGKNKTTTKMCYVVQGGAIQGLEG